MVKKTILKRCMLIPLWNEVRLSVSLYRFMSLMVLEVHAGRCVQQRNYLFSRQGIVKLLIPTQFTKYILQFASVLVYPMTNPPLQEVHVQHVPVFEPLNDEFFLPLGIQCAKFPSFNLIGQPHVLIGQLQ